MNSSLEKRRHVRLAALVALALIGAPGMRAETAWFSGGSYDGYDYTCDTAIPDYPQVNNAGGATNIEPTSVWLNGMLVHTGAAPTKVYVFWGKNDGGTVRNNWTNSHPFGLTTEFEPLSYQAVTEQGQYYYYRFYATNTAGQESWASASSAFRTPSVPVMTVSAAPGITVAVLRGALIAGVEATIWFDWGAATQGVNPAVTNTVAMGSRTEAGTVIAPNPFQSTVSSLNPATTYAYRIRGQNAYGLEVSPWAWFTTFPEPSDFIKFPNLKAWFGGHSFDGYDRNGTTNKLSPYAGMLIRIR